MFLCVHAREALGQFVLSNLTKLPKKDLNCTIGDKNSYIPLFLSVLGNSFR